MTTSTFYGSDCGCPPMLGTGQSSMEAGLNLFRRLWVAFKCRIERMISFEDALQGSWIGDYQGKTVEFDTQEQFKREEDRTRWLSMAAANHSGGDLPPADLVDLDARYLVRAEDYRISVGQGQQYLDAETTRMHNQKMWF